MGIAVAVSRAVWRRDLRTAKKLFAETALGRQHLRFVGGVPELVDPRAFAVDYAEAKKKSFEVRKAFAAGLEHSKVPAIRKKAAEQRENSKRRAFLAPDARAEKA